MGKRKIGHKANSFINGEWARHAGSKFIKRLTSSKRRIIDKKIIFEELKNLNDVN